jgi:hypothetical protein
MCGCTEQNGIEVTDKRWEAVPHTGDDLSGGVMHDREMGNEPGRCRELLAQSPSDGR